MRTGAIIQARLSSSRLPRKVLKSLPFQNGPSVLANIVHRLRHVSGIDQIIIATSDNEEDRELSALADSLGVGFFAGSLDDVLSRFYFAAKKYSLDTIVRVTGDCPCLDPAIVSDLLAYHHANNHDYTSNALQRNYPIGYDVSALSFDAIQKAHESAVTPAEREHITTYIYKTRPDLFKFGNFSKIGLPEGISQIRATLDTKEDYSFLCAVFDALYEKNPIFGLSDFLGLMDAKPWLRELNAEIIHRKALNNISEEREELIKIAQSAGMRYILPYLQSLAQENE